MTIELSEYACPDCGERLHVIYVTELRQVVSGYSCKTCGFVRSETQGFDDTVAFEELEEYVLRVERPLTSDDVRDPIGDVEGEFRARASAEMDEDEVWTLLDPASGEVVDLMAGAEIKARADIDDGDGTQGEE
jgi:DNA-directed RNA polymerase subunit RPC12/RpoP